MGGGRGGGWGRGGRGGESEIFTVTPYLGGVASASRDRLRGDGEVGDETVPVVRRRRRRRRRRRGGDCFLEPPGFYILVCAYSNYSTIEATQ